MCGFEHKLSFKCLSILTLNANNDSTIHIINAIFIATSRDFIVRFNYFHVMHFIDFHKTDGSSFQIIRFTHLLHF